MASPDAQGGIDAARDARRELGFGLEDALPDLLRAVEEGAGVPVVIGRLDAGVAGAYVLRGGRPLVFLNGAQAAVRQRFTLAHELGHHRLGHGAQLDAPSALGDLEHDPLEVGANHFAAEFIAPRAAVAAQAPYGPIGLDVVVRMAARFGLSAKAMRIRLQTAGVLTDRARCARLDREIEQNLHRALAVHLDLQDLEDELARAPVPRLPDTLRTGAFGGLAAGRVGLEEAARAAGRPAEDVARAAAALGF